MPHFGGKFMRLWAIFLAYSPATLLQAFRCSRTNQFSLPCLASAGPSTWAPAIHICVSRQGPVVWMLLDQSCLLTLLVSLQGL